MPAIGWVFDRSVVKGAMTQLVAPVTDDLSNFKKAAKEARPSVCILAVQALWFSNGVKAVGDLLEAKGIPEDHYVVGAANAGKSSFLNRLTLRKRRGVGRVLSEDDQSGFVVSVLPGTTLRPITMKQSNIKLIDMPGLLVPGSMAERLTLEDLKDRPYQFTVFASEKLKIHRTRVEKASRICQEWVGDKLTPPMDERRYPDLLPWKATRFELTGTGWDESCVDVVFPGLGWIAITGCGDCVVEAHAPEGVEISIREPLMPYEAKWTGVKYRGSPGWFLGTAEVGMRCVVKLAGPS
eukprot:Skav226351  [mRNA]  locus=scaffold2980:290118:303127:- [translate_table: standard]